MQTAFYAPASPPARCDATGAATAESRYDPITGDWTIFAPQRGQRPNEFRAPPVMPKRSATCPFCQGHEAKTPPAVWVGRTAENDSPPAPFEPLQPVAEDQWSVRVVPNKYPAISPIHQSPSGDGQRGRSSSLFRGCEIAGGHEVIIESPRHIRSMSELDLPEAAVVFAAYRHRIRHWRSVPGIEYISVFKNVGGDAGASLQHGHSQLIATNRLPAAVRSVTDRMQQHHATTGCCLQCDLIRGEVKEKQRVIAETDSLIAYCPYASQLPMLVRMTTKRHQDRFEDLADDTIEEISWFTRRIIRWLEELRPETAYNCLLHTRPPGATGDSDAYHWSLEVFPRMTHIAGFEFSSQCMINPTLPEVAAAAYRGRAAAENPRLIR